MKKRIMSFLVAVMMCVSLLPAAWAEGGNEQLPPTVAEENDQQPGENVESEDRSVQPQAGDEVLRVVIPEYLQDAVTY